MNNNLIVKEESILYDYLRNNLNESKNTIKGFLVKRMVSVNGKITTKYNHNLHIGDRIEIGNRKIETNNKDIDIIYEDKDLIVVNKPSGLLTIATEKEKDRTLYNMVSSYVKKSDKNNKIFIVHRLDRDTSGVVIFARNEGIKNKLQTAWNDIATRKYIAIVHGKVKDSDTIEVHLKENKMGNSYIDKSGDLAITKYKKVAGNEDYSFVDIDLLTGKKNQIRVSFAHIGCPILGDKKYGTVDDSKRMMLHANRLELINPITNKKMIFETKIPKEFNYYKKNMEKGE